MINLGKRAIWLIPFGGLMARVDLVIGSTFTPSFASKRGVMGSVDCARKLHSVRASSVKGKDTKALIHRLPCRLLCDVQPLALLNRCLCCLDEKNLS